MTFKPQLFFKEATLFAATLVIGIFTAYRYSLMPESFQLPDIRFTFWDAVIIALLILFFVFAPRYKRISKFTFRFFLIFIVLAGAQIIFGTLLVFPFDLLAAFAVVMIFIFLRNVLSHNIGVIIGIAGITAVIGLAISPRTAVILLVALSFYDIFSVYVTKHMVKMARNMIESGAPFGFIVPSDGGSFFHDRKEAQAGLGQQFMILGSGDIGLPLILCCSLMGINLGDSIMVALFSLGGLFLTHMIFINQKVRKPMAALPPIATMAIIGYAVALLI